MIQIRLNPPADIRQYTVGMFGITLYANTTGEIYSLEKEQNIVLAVNVRNENEKQLIISEIKEIMPSINIGSMQNTIMLQLEDVINEYSEVSDNSISFSFNSKISDILQKHEINTLTLF